MTLELQTKSGRTFAWGRPETILATLNYHRKLGARLDDLIVVYDAVELSANSCKRPVTA